MRLKRFNENFLDETNKIIVSIKDLYSRRNEIADWAVENGCGELEILRDTTENIEAFGVVFQYYVLAKEHGFSCIQLDYARRNQLISWYNWLIETYGVPNEHIHKDIKYLYNHLGDSRRISMDEWIAVMSAARSVTTRRARSMATRSMTMTNFYEDWDGTWKKVITELYNILDK